MAKKGIFILLTLCLALSANAQSLKTDSTQTSSSQELPVFSYASPKKYVIADIKVTGLTNKTYEDYVIINFSRLAIGDTIEVPGKEITTAVKQFIKQGLFADVAIFPVKVENNKIWLEIRLKDNPRITDIHYEGMKKSEREDIEKKISMVKGTQVTLNMIDRANTIIKSYFNSKGFNKATVDITQTRDPEKPNEVYLSIKVDKKEKIKVNNIIITGNKELSSLTLEQAMKKTRHKHTWRAKIRNFLRSTNFIPDNYIEDKKNLMAKYNEKGYRDAVIAWDTVYNVSDKKVNIEIKVEEGKQYVIRSITWVGNTKFSSEDLQTALDMKAGDVYNQTKLSKRLSDDEDAVRNIFYYNQGYIFSSAEPVETNIENDSVDLEIRVTEGVQATINRVTISGNDRVYEDVIRRELRTKPGALFSREELMRSLREVAQMGHFDPENLKPDVSPDQESGTVDIGYPLVSKANDQVELSAGWGQTGIIGRVSLKFTNFSIKNLFNPSSYKGIIPQGDGQTLTLSGQTNGRYYQSYSISFMDPWFGGKRPNMLSVGTYLSYQTDMSSYYNKYNNYSTTSTYSNYYDNYSTTSSSLYNTSKHILMFGGSIAYGKRLNWPDDYFQLQGELSYQLYSMKDWDYFIVRNGNCNSLSLNFTLSRNSMDQPIYTRKGSQFSLSLDFTPPYSWFDGRDYASMTTDDDGYQKAKKYEWIEYHKWKFKSKTFHPLIPSIQKTPVLMTRAEFGVLGYYNEHKKSPFGTFYVGGDGMTGYSSTYATETVGLRGYENGSIATNASAYTRLGLELRYPVMLEPTSTIYLLSFIDAGNAWSSVKDTNPFSLKRSAGFGVRIMLPMIGLMGIDWGYGFDKVSSNGTMQTAGGKFNFIIGQEF
jgi:outer membrane protein insertion porin family